MCHCHAASPERYTHDDLHFLLVHFGVAYDAKEFTDSNLTGVDVKDGITKDMADVLGIKAGGKLAQFNAHIKRASEASKGAYYVHV
jgi:hypothetical protein